MVNISIDGFMLDINSCGNQHIDEDIIKDSSQGPGPIATDCSVMPTEGLSGVVSSVRSNRISITILFWSGERTLSGFGSFYE